MSHYQVQNAQNLYDYRASTYDDSFHPRFARHMIELANLQSGDAVLDLACGTGLATFQASKTIGPNGRVVGVDVSNGMLAQAESKKADHTLQNVELLRHSITDLETLPAVKGRTFDAITCCSALVLLEHPVEALRDWQQYLKPGGRLVVDVTHIQNLIAGVLMERVGQRIGHPLPWNRLAFPTGDSLQEAMEQAGLVKIEMLFLSQILSNGAEGSQDLKDYVQDLSDPKILREYNVDDADSVFDGLIDTLPMRNISSPPEIREQARELFREEWRRASDADGKVREVDGVIVGIGVKP